jgi:TetR/AcrR family transcriptional regulator of autoinduction and epiphytic fitness
MSQSEVVIREDPRVARTREAVGRATLEVLAERGWAGFTVEAVSEAAGVARSTIYRHWPTRIALVADALEALNRQPRPDRGEVEGGARAQVEALIVHLTEAFSDSVLSGCIPALVEAAEHEPEVAAFLHGYSAQRRATLVRVLADGITSGELPPHLDPDLASAALAGAVAYFRTMTAEPLSRDRAAALVTQVLGPP